MVLEIKFWIVKHFKRIQHVFLVLDARKCWIKNLVRNKFYPTSSNTIFFFFYEMLDEIGAFKRIQQFVQHHKFRMLDVGLKKTVLRNIANDNTWYSCDKISSQGVTIQRNNFRSLKNVCFCSLFPNNDYPTITNCYREYDNCHEYPRIWLSRTA